MAKRFRFAFAENGNRATVEDATQASGLLSYQVGYGPQYSLDIQNDPTARRINRDRYNQVLHDITSNVQEWQNQLYPDYVPPSSNGGAPVSYGKGMIVTFSGVSRISLVDSNTTQPDNTSNWDNAFPIPVSLGGTSGDDAASARSNLSVSSTTESQSQSNTGDSQGAGGKIHPSNSQSSAAIGDTGLVNVTHLIDYSAPPGVRYKLSKPVDGTITALSFTAKTATVGSDSVVMWRDLNGYAPQDAQESANGIPSITFPAVEQTVTTALTTDSELIAGGNLVFRGEKKEKSIVNANLDTPLPIRDNAHLSSFSLVGDTSTEYGNAFRAISTTNQGLQAYSVFDEMAVSGYRVGAFIRNAVNQTYSNLNWRNNRCHILLSRAPYFNSGNPISPGGWNQADGQGFFQNINRFQNTNFSFGEVGIFGTSLCGTFDNVSTQVQVEDPAGNSFLPPGHRGTGVWLQGGIGFDNRRGSGCNSFRGWYSEGSDQGLFIKDQEYFEMSSSFMQGGSSSEPSRFAEVDNSIAHFKGVIKYDWFNEFIIQNNSTVYHSDATQGAGGSVMVDQSSKYRPRGDIDRDKWESNFSAPGSSLGNVYPLDGEIPERGFATLRVILLNNGIDQEVYTADIARYFNGIPVIAWKASPSARFTAAGDANGVIRLTLTTNNSLTVDALLDINGGADISGNAITILPE